MDQFERECHSYTRYLTGERPPAYVVNKYRDFHRKSDALAALKFDPFDQFLVETSARGPLWARLADSYASRFRRDSAVRKKLVVTLAILECAPPISERLDAVGRGGMPGAILRMGCGAMLYAACLLLSLVLFTPARVGLTVTRRPSSPAEVLEP
jgi:hypothetical protein